MRGGRKETHASEWEEETQARHVRARARASGCLITKVFIWLFPKVWSVSGESFESLATPCNARALPPVRICGVLCARMCAHAAYNARKRESV